MEQLKGLLSRVTSIDKTGIKTQPNPDIQREDPKRIEAAEQLMREISDTIVIKNKEARIRENFVSLNLDVEGKTNKVLIKYLAATQVELEFEKVHNLIFGSQIFLLKQLNEVRDKGKSPEEINKHFENIQNLFPETFSVWTSENYLEFLLSRTLIILENDSYHITTFGKEYLVWMAQTGKRENKSL